MTKALRKLGKKQVLVLRSLKQHRRWNRNCGWTWQNNSETERLLQSLVLRGLVTVTVEQVLGGHCEVYRAKESEDDSGI